MNLPNSKTNYMKKLIYSLILSAISLAASAQNPSFTPGTFSAEDQVTLTVDIAGTPLAGAAEAYIWIFSNPDGTGGNNGNVNGEWTNSSNAAKMTAAGANKWSFTFTGTTLFGKSPAELKSFGFLVKKKDGSAQTPDYKPFAFDPLVFVPSMLRIFPAKIGSDDVVSVNFDRSLAVTPVEQRITPVSATITAFDETDTQVGAPVTINVRSTGTTVWTATFIPSARFTPGTGHTLKKFKYKFNGTVLDITGTPMNISSTEAEVIFSNLH
jgi:hypothetical protein